ncbi:MAG: alpha-L-arabinofuranosidase C-terminal domain-containing protein [Bacteroidales bacterium]
MKKELQLLTLILLAFPTMALSQNTIVLKAGNAKTKINKEIYGHFAEHLGHCIYGGIFVGTTSSIPNTKGYRNDVVKALKEMSIPMLRWPGGCFADTYHWKDGIGKPSERPSIVNVHWGGVTEDNSFGTHEFLDYCELIGAEPYISLNVGSGTVKEASEWVEYVTSDVESPMTNLRKQNGREKPWNVKYWGMGNETWGCGGNMRPEYYADLFRQFGSYTRAPHMYRIASGANSDDYNWTEVLLKYTAKLQWMIQGTTLHYYTVCHNWDKKGSATQFDEKEWYTTMRKTLFMEELVNKHSQIMDKYDPKKNVALVVDEWGNWFDVEPGTNPGFLYQQNSLRDAVVAGINLNIFNNHADRVKIANVAQMVNVLQSVILTKEDQMVLTPTYYVFKMFKVHHDATLIPIVLQSELIDVDGTKIKAINASASVKDGVINLSLCNLSTSKSIKINCRIEGANTQSATGEIITSANINDYNDFGQPEKVNIKEFTGFKLEKSNLSIELPAKSVVTIRIKT